MNWIVDLFRGNSVANAVVILSVAGALGLMLGSIRVWGISLGIGGVLFSGLALGHLGLSGNEHMIDFAKDFGLVLFVYTVGIQVGPGFFSSLRREGLPLNLMAAAIVLLGGLLVVILNRQGLIDLPSAAGIFSGATTNTPALAASQQALLDLGGKYAQQARMPALSYAVTYPFGIIGSILTMVLIRVFFRINPTQEAAQFLQLTTQATPRPTAVNLEVTNPNLEGITIDHIPTLQDSGVVISRTLHDGKLVVAQHDTTIHVGDVLLAVGPTEALEQLRLVVGSETCIDLRTLPSRITNQKVIVTKKAVLGKSISELDSLANYGVAITRVSRAEIEFTPTTEFKLQFGDRLMAVGEEKAIQKLAAEVGNSTKELNLPQLIPVLIGLALGILLGNWPIHISGMPVPLKLGLAGGPLLVAIILSRIGNLGPLVWYLPSSANLALREMGIVLFLAAVGLRNGEQFVKTLTEGPGVEWLLYGVLITGIPLALVGFIARFFYKLNFASLCGLIAGGMTDPPALAFAGQATSSDAPYVSYATVYPLVVILRVLSAQALVLFILK